MSGPALFDQADRDRIEHSLDETLFVEAGAGTGKTSQLVERIVNLISTGRAEANQIAAITFTVKAAAELRDRILERLETESEQAHDEQRREHCRAALDQLDGAAIETIHSFARRILVLYPLEAKLPPGFEILDDIASIIEFDRHWRDQLDEMLEDAELQPHLLEALDAGVNLAHLGRLAGELHENWDRAEAESSRMAAFAVDPQPLSRALIEICGRRDKCADPTDGLYLRLEEIAKFNDGLRAVQDDVPALAEFLRENKISFRTGNKGRKANWPNGAKQEITADLRELEAEYDALRSAANSRALPPLYNAIREFVLDYAAERRRRGRIGFQDLLVHCRDLLCSRPEVAAQVRERYRYLLIDEFQDTDPLQTEIANAIVQEQAGRLFFVGDPKQSIYRFRRADIEQYNAVGRHYTDSRVHLTQNFRSQPGVAEFVNAVFAPLMQADQSGGQADWEDLRAAREALDEDEAPVVTVIGGESEASTAQMRQAEAEELGRIIADVQASAWPVFDRAADAWRPATYADIAVLAPSRSGLTRLLPELEERGVPYRLESRALVYHTDEVRQLLGVLRAIDDPTDQIALAGSLRSPAFACSDADLFRWREAGGRWDYRAPRPNEIAAAHPVAEAMRWLQAASDAQWRMSVSALVEYVIRERRLLELAVVDRRPRDRWQRVRFLLDQARAFCDGGGRTLSEFLEWAQRQADADVRVIESIVPEPDSDAVRILTIHAAKGLEFPVVILAGLNIEPRNLTLRPVLLWSAAGAPELHLKRGLATPGYDELYEHERALGQAERVRLNYVATTRARDHLVVSLWRKQKASGSDDAHVLASQVDQLPRADGLPRFRRIAIGEAPDPAPPVAPAAAPLAKDSLAAREQWIAERGAAIRASTGPAAASATNIARRVDADPNLEKHEPSEDLPPWRRGRAGTSIGRAVHSALQVIDLAAATEAEIRATADAQSAAEGLSLSAADEVARLIRAALRSRTLREAVRSDRYWRELYVAAPIPDGSGGQTLLEGFIDLLYETEDGRLIVVDYKTDALRRGEAVDAALKRYRLQGAAYALALEESLGRPVTACRFLFLHANEERDVEDLAGAMAQVQETLRESAAG